MAGQKCHHIAAVAHRHRPEQTLLGHRGAHGVGDQQGGRGGGPALRHADHHAVIAANPHQIVAEGQIGQQLPLTHDGMQMVHSGAGQDGVLGEQVPEG